MHRRVATGAFLPVLIAIFVLAPAFGQDVPLTPAAGKDLPGEKIGVLFGSYGDVDKVEEVEGLGQEHPP